MKLRILLLLLSHLLRRRATGRGAGAARAKPADVGNYCGMNLIDHPGPKAQIFLAGREDPLWFTQVRDAIVFTRLPEEPRDIIAIWVNDMGRTTNWDAPEAGAWSEARNAWYVIGSGGPDGMGAPEAVPFGTEAAAGAFAAAHGGSVVRLDGIPDDYMLGGTSPPGEAAVQPRAGTSRQKVMTARSADGGC